MKKRKGKPWTLDFFHEFTWHEHWRCLLSSPPPSHPAPNLRCSSPRTPMNALAVISLICMHGAQVPVEARRNKSKRKKKQEEQFEDEQFEDGQCEDDQLRIQYGGRWPEAEVEEESGWWTRSGGSSEAASGSFKRRRKNRSGRSGRSRRRRRKNGTRIMNLRKGKYMF